jgi:alkylhydroperoxidase family enzyme
MDPTLDHGRAFIGIVPDEDWAADEALAAQYDGVVDRNYERVDNILAIHSLNPTAMAAHNALYLSAMSGTATLRKVEREMIALVVSLENHCHY